MEGEAFVEREKMEGILVKEHFLERALEETLENNQEAIQMEDLEGIQMREEDSVERQGTGMML